MSICRCTECERFVDTDDECGEEIAGRWVCERCADEMADGLQAYAAREPINPMGEEHGTH